MGYNEAFLFANFLHRTCTHKQCMLSVLESSLAMEINDLSEGFSLV